MDKKLTLGHINKHPEKYISWMCYDFFITIDNQVINMSFELKNEVLRCNSYCYFINGAYRTKKWIRNNCIKVLGLIFND